MLVESWGYLGRPWGVLGGILGALGAILARSSGHLGGILVGLGGFWRGLGAILRPSLGDQLKKTMMFDVGNSNIVTCSFTTNSKPRIRFFPFDVVRNLKQRNVRFYIEFHSEKPILRPNRTLRVGGSAAFGGMPKSSVGVVRAGGGKKGGKCINVQAQMHRRQMLVGATKHIHLVSFLSGREWLTLGDTRRHLGAWHLEAFRLTDLKVSTSLKP